MYPQADRSQHNCQHRLLHSWNVQCPLCPSRADPVGDVDKLSPTRERKKERDVKLLIFKQHYFVFVTVEWLDDSFIPNLPESEQRAQDVISKKDIS